LELLEILVLMTRGEYLALYNAGVKSVSDLWALPTGRVADLLGKHRASQVEKVRPRYLNPGAFFSLVSTSRL